jgi:hypothetical protein
MSPSLFEFQELLITQRVLDRLGFGEYWDEHGTWGTRTLSLVSTDVELFILDEQEEMDDDMEGHHVGGAHVAQTWQWNGVRNNKLNSGNSIYQVYFLHQLYDIIAAFYPTKLALFEQKAYEANLARYVLSYKDYKNGLELMKLIEANSTE